MKPVYVSIILSVLLFSCNKPVINRPASVIEPAEYLPTKPLDNTLSSGTWNWVQSEGGISYRRENPANTGKSLQIQFDADGTVRYYKDHTLQYTGSYLLAPGTDPNTGDNVRTITQNYFGYYTAPETDILVTGNNTITFREPGSDRFEHTFSKVNF